MTTDRELLQRFSASGDETAFRAFVDQHLGWIHSVALRRLNGDAHLAQDACQLVFSELSRQAAHVAAHPTPSGWLFRTTHHLTAKLARTEQRRRVRERTAMSLRNADDDTTHLDWSRLSPLIDDALAELKDDDRTAVLLRFYENRDYAAIGAQLDLTANAARMRVDRALDKLNTALARRGIASTTAVLGSALGANLVGAAPAGLAATVTTTALAGSAATVGGAFTFLTMAKLPLSITAAVIVAGSATLLVQPHIGAADATPMTVSPATTTTPPLTAGAPPSPSVTTTPAGGIDDAYAALADEADALNRQLAEVEDATNRALSQAATPGKIYSTQEVDVAPKPTLQTNPVYPFELRRQLINGESLVSFVVDATGTVRDLHVVRTTDEEFAKASLNAMAQWKFEPGLVAEQAVNVRMEVPMKFQIRNPTPGEGPTVYEWF